jgi:hypothetical protein
LAAITRRRSLRLRFLLSGYPRLPRLCRWPCGKASPSPVRATSVSRGSAAGTAGRLRLLAPQLSHFSSRLRRRRRGATQPSPFALRSLEPHIPFSSRRDVVRIAQEFTPGTFAANQPVPEGRLTFLENPSDLRGTLVVKAPAGGHTYMGHTFTMITIRRGVHLGLRSGRRPSAVPPALRWKLAWDPRVETLGYFHGVPPGPGAQPDHPENCRLRAIGRSLRLRRRSYQSPPIQLNPPMALPPSPRPLPGSRQLHARPSFDRLQFLRLN